MDLHTGRPPVFVTDSDLGTFRHDNKVVIKIDVDDLDSTGNPFVYTIQSGSLPDGVTLNDSTGVISGTPPATSGGQTYTFVVRVDNGFEYQDKSYSLTVNDSVTNITISGGVTIGAGISLG